MRDELIQIPKELGIIPIKGGVVFPDQIVPLIIHTQKLVIQKLKNQRPNKYIKLVVLFK
jgi:hypothetical protein